MALEATTEWEFRDAAGNRVEHVTDPSVTDIADPRCPSGVSGYLAMSGRVLAELPPDQMEALAERVAKKLRSAPHLRLKGVELVWTDWEERKHAVCDVVDDLFREMSPRLEGTNRQDYRLWVQGIVGRLGDTLMAAWAEQHKETDATPDR